MEDLEARRFRVDTGMSLLNFMVELESGDRPIRLEEAVAVAGLLGVGLEELVYGREDTAVRIQRIERALAALAQVEQHIARQMDDLRRGRPVTTGTTASGGMADASAPAQRSVPG